MCGIVGAVAKRDITNVLLEGLQHLEYRGYDSAGVAVVNKTCYLQRLRRVGKVNALIKANKSYPISGDIGVAHTRWATHGEPTENNAHPHISKHIVVAHNGIIENYQILRKELLSYGYNFVSVTDTEVIAHLVHWEQKQHGGTLVEIIQRVVNLLQGDYGMVVIDSCNPNVLVSVRSSSSLVIGKGINENFVASDQLAFPPFIYKFIFLEEGDIAEITYKSIRIWNKFGCNIKRPEINPSYINYHKDRGIYCHYMEKEIFEQPEAIKKTIEGRYFNGKIILPELNSSIKMLLNHVQHIQIIACGTSYHSGMVARYWFESLAGIPCDVEIASEFRYRNPAVRSGSLLIIISQSGETADTLAALRLSKTLNYLCSIAICNVPNSSITREADITLMTYAGIEIGVASTKAFTTQLTVLLMFVAFISHQHPIKVNIESNIVHAIQVLPERIKQILTIYKSIETLAKNFHDKNHALFLGRDILYPIAMEGALKLKEISYIHAEAYAAGELKHGPLALIDNNMPVIVIMNNNKLLNKITSNIKEIQTRKGLLYIFAENNIDLTPSKNINIVSLPNIEEITVPIVYAIPLQLLAYCIGKVKGTNIDQPRNLAKSVTVE